VAEVAYVGNHGTRFPVQYNLNAAVTQGVGATGQPLFGAFGRTQDTILFFNGYDSHYNSLQAKLDKRFSGGFSMTTAYTFGKALAPVNEDAVSGFQYYVNPQRNYARTSFDRTHTFVQSYIYELPFGKNKRWLNSGPAAYVLGGWQVNGILTLMSGAPINFSSNVANNAPGNSQTPNQVKPFQVLGGVNDSPWFDTSSFVSPVANTFGNVGRNAASGPNFYNLDASLFKIFQIAERYRLEFRAEAFSLPNSPSWQLNNPNTNVNDSNFGYIRGAGGSRTMQLGLKLQF
jgi:hypothetical protein